MTRRPKYNRCDFCGDRQHKVAVRRTSGEVVGYCPTCWTTSNPLQPQPLGERVVAAGGVVLYDRRAKK